MKAIRTLIVIVAGMVLLPFAMLFLYFVNGRAARPRRVAAETPESVGRAEKQLGRALPRDLRDFYMSGRHMKGGWFGLKDAAKEYKKLTKAPYGPRGQDWPAELFPIAERDEGYVCFDLAGGEVVIWDAEEIAGGNEGNAAWKRSFKPTGKPLPAYAG
jgi:hypothetical protein